MLQAQCREAILARVLTAHSTAAYVLADSSKLGVIAVHRVCPLDQVTAVITDDQETPGASARLAAGVASLRAAQPRRLSLTAAG
jgi:DeoR family glycerol-3-phosphate regulon repressor